MIQIKSFIIAIFLLVAPFGVFCMEQSDTTKINNNDEDKEERVELSPLERSIFLKIMYERNRIYAYRVKGIYIPIIDRQFIPRDFNDQMNTIKFSSNRAHQLLIKQMEQLEIAFGKWNEKCIKKYVSESELE